MSIPGSASPLFFQTAAGAGTLTLEKSVRFNDDDSAYLDRTPSSAGNRKKWTWSGWVKKCKNGATQCLFYGGTSNSNLTRIIHGPDSLELQHFDNGSFTGRLETNANFLDPSAWYHFVVAVDTSQGTASDRIKLYVNGVLQDSFLAANYPSQNLDLHINNTNKHSIAVEDAPGGAKSYFFDGYMADVYHIDGQQLDCTSFGAFDDNGVWQAAAYSGTFGTNGFHLFDFANESGIGDDSSGNDNDFTANNLNLTNVVDPTSPASGNIYSNNYIGYYLNGNPPLFLTYDPGSTNRADSIAHGGNTGTTWAVDDVLQWAIDWDAGKIWLGRNNTWYASGNPAGGTNPAISSFSTAYTYFLALGYNSNNFELQVPSSASYTPPTGFSYWGGQTLSTFKNSGTNQGGTPDIFKTAIPKSGKTYIEAIIKGGTNTYVTLGLCNFGETTLTSDVLRDVPTNGDAADDTGAGGELSSNYPTMNPLAKNSNTTLSNGNLDVSSTAVYTTLSTIAFPSTGKFYAEFTINGTASGYPFVGIGGFNDTAIYSNANPNTGAFYAQGGYVTGSVSVSSLTALYAGDIIGVAYDASNGKVWFSINGTYVSSGDPANGTNATCTLSANASGYALATSTYQAGTVSLNAGQRAFNTNAPSGFKCLCTSNLPTPTVADGSAHFDVKLYQGNGTSASSTQAITGFSFSPNLVWMKARSVTAASGIYDTVRGVTERLASEKTAIYQNEGYFESFDSNGFTVKGNSNNTNANNETYVAWCWNIPGSASSNTDGTITSSVTKNADSGVSIVTWTGTGSAGTIGHGLGSKPDLIIARVYGDTTYSDNWPVYSSAFDGTHYAYLNDTRKFTDFPDFWNDGTATSTVFPIGGDNSDNTKSLIAYCFTSVAGHSAFGSYVGNGSTDGVFVHTNFRPAFIGVKRTNGAGNWHTFDTKRDPHNRAEAGIYSNLTSAEAVVYFADINSNGFKLRTSNAELNGNNDTYIYFCFAENSFQANGGLAR
jgi:hypothetical protein